MIAAPPTAIAANQIAAEAPRNLVVSIMAG
jgi:hypothetical protein